MVFWKRSPDPRARLRERIGEYELPSFSTSAISTLSLLRADADMADIAEGLLADPGLTVRILRTVNSAGFGLRHEITNVVSAAKLLGRSRLESLVLTAAVGESIPAPTGFDNEGFWQTWRSRPLPRDSSRTWPFRSSRRPIPKGTVVSTDRPAPIRT